MEGSVERGLEGEITGHLSYEAEVPEGTSNRKSRKSKGRKTVQVEAGEIEVSVPSERSASFKPQLVREGQHQLDGLDYKVQLL